ncbi:hypothetical protein [Mucilaginibacter terrae]|uniref:Stationary phase survival protein SurE n=1 Tax=Mucilaginibacter terrae TaxID=1955052 RepID=A0ABU3GWH2_9SPHI|nr:hypothetical protein [Mucilaginibacter terrae]MDT3402995.1 hypothetical protein [Mucilaginibacter terrae]
MLSKNSMALGVLLGAVLPGIAWLVFGFFYKDAFVLNKPAIPYIIAIGLNLVLIRVLHSKGADNTTRGIMLASFACMVLLIVFKVRLT